VVARWLLPIALLASTASAQDLRTVNVRVTDAVNRQPVPAAQVQVVGTTTGGTTNADGRLVLRGLAPGNHELRVLRVGYAEQKKVAIVGAAAGETAIEFALQPVSIQLSPVVTTATGEQRRVEIGNAVSTIDVAKKMEEAPIRSMGDVLVAKAPGVQVLPGNMTGSGGRVRIRGTASISLSNDPIYVIDGIRMTSGSGSGSNSTGGGAGVGGTTHSRVADINPEEIENIEIVKGPSAATLYGTDAANGVIVITTKRGRAGAARWTVYADQGMVQDRNDYPTMYAILGHRPATPNTPIKCLLKETSAAVSATGATCVVDSLTSVNVYDDDFLTPIKDGWRNQLGLQVAGGTESVRYFVSGDQEKEMGPYGIPDFERQRFDTLKIPIDDYVARPNALRKGAYRANLNMAVSPKLDLAVTSGFIRLEQRLPQVDNNVNSFWYNGMVGPGFKGPGPGYTGIGNLGQRLYGYAQHTPGNIFQTLAKQQVSRFIGSTNGNWRPTGWLAIRGDVGMDLTDRVDNSLCMRAQCANFGTQREGFASDRRADILNFTTNLSGSGSWQPRPWLNLKSTAGMQYGSFELESNIAQGNQLPPGARTADDGAIPSVTTNTILQKTVGLFVEEVVALNDRLFLTAALRTDQNSAFGTNFQRVYYPKGAISWIISDEGFFPQMGWLNQFRLRTAVGASGVQPGPNDADRTLQTVTTNIAATDVGGLQSNQLGNADLKPERSTEYEGGFEAQMFNSRLSLDLTYYHKLSTDALIDMPLAGSQGSNVTVLRTNLGKVRNTGFEALVNAQIVQRRMFAWDVTFNASHLTNEVVSLGTDQAGKAIPPIGTGNVRQVEGYPINGYWARPFTWGDANNDGIITPNEVNVKAGSADTAFTFLGYSQPRLELSITNGVSLFNNRLRLTALVDHKGGYHLSNTEQSFLCQQSTSCVETSTLNPPLWRQARAIAIRDGTSPNTTNAGYYEKPEFWRIREVAATYELGENLARRVKARGASLNVAARNLKIFTDWTGVDPEQNYGENDTQNTLLTAGPQSYFTARLTVRF
jgi:TonB-linked SusC/RagA family outer membrane protein